MFENLLFIIPLSMGIVFSLAGLITLKFPPQKINSLYGYRTPSSMKSDERWSFAQSYSSKEMIKLGLILSACSLFGFLTTFDNFTNMIIDLILMIIMVIILLLRVEKAIKNKFDKV